MNTTTSDYDYDTLDAGMFSDADLRKTARAAEEALVRAVGPSPGKDSFGSPDCLHIDLPDDSWQTWELVFQRFKGAWRIVVLEESSRRPLEDRVTVAPTAPLAEAGLVPLLHFVPKLEAFAEVVLRQVARERDRVESAALTKDRHGQ